ncbi:MAG: 3-oxoacyl-[acyl-carrier-protein] synthase-1 [Francisellaceae bacterium]
MGIVLGTSTSGIGSSEHAWKAKQIDNKFPEKFNYAQQDIASCSTFLAQYADIQGVCYTISTACSSSGKAIAAADRLIKSGLCDAVITGGSDSLCELTLNGFDSLELVSAKICQPFSENRSGLNIGEGAALFILSKDPSEIKLSGIGESSDGYHISAPDPDGNGGKIAINQALKSANLQPQDIGYINLHGTATRKNDEVESKMVHDVFGDETYCSSTKPLIGHTLGAAGAHELAFCWLLLSAEYNPECRLPAHVWDKKYDSKLPKIGLMETEKKWQKRNFMSNSFAFGGSNISLIISRCD